MDAILWLNLLLFSASTIAFDPSLSNGTCYFGAGEQADNGYIPCGNAAGGVQTCCQARDICLSSNACFNGQYYVTYVAGCTDENYDDPACPKKGDFASQQWVGLVRCKVSDDQNEEWGGCEEPVQPKVNKGNEQCTCTASSSTALFTDAATLKNIASLPVSAGNAIAWYSGYEPSTTVSETTATSSISTRSAGSTASITAPLTSPSSTAAPPSLQPSNSLSTGAKAGIGAGAAIGAVAAGSLLIWFLWYRRRRNRSVPAIQDQIRPSSIDPWKGSGGGIAGRNDSTRDNHRSWGDKSELPTEANDITTTKTSLGETTIRTGLNTPTTPYHPYQHSPTVEASEADGSPAGSTSRLAPSGAAYSKPEYSRPIYEMPA